LFILVLLALNISQRGSQFYDYLSEMSSHVHTLSTYIAYHGVDLGLLASHWNLHLMILMGLFLVITLVPIFTKAWSLSFALLGVFGLMTTGLYFHQVCSGNSWLIWGVPTSIILLALISKIANLKWISFIAAWGLGLCLSFVQMSQLSLQLGMDHFILFPQWLLLLSVISGSLLLQQILQVNQQLKTLNISTPASTFVGWYTQFFRQYFFTWFAVIFLIALTLIPSFEWESLISIYFLVAAFQLAVLHLVLFPMMLNVMGVFRKSSSQ
jgi:hypothetical protein